jgi:endonuclease-3
LKLTISPVKLKRAEALLQEQWGTVRRKPRRDPLEELILTILSQNTSDFNSGRAFLSLRQRFSDWEAVRLAPLAEIEEAIREGGLSRIKARRIQAILKEIHGQRGHLSLDFLKRLSDEEVWAYLGRFKGVGPKTAACVMLFSLGRPAFPVDTHVFRVISRLLGMVGEVSPIQVQEGLQKQAPPELMYSLHLHLVRHGRRICRPATPHCEKCSLLPLCAYGKRHGREGSRKSARRI